MHARIKHYYLLLPTITGHSPPSESTRKLFSFPARWGGLGLPEPSAPELLLLIISMSSYATLLLIVLSTLLRFLLLNCIENL